ncbi:MAG: hypothetical protein U0414_02380 [Polyangiaceae bacterium]
MGLFDAAAGRDRALDDSLVDVEDVDRHHLLTEVDEFENLWFPRIDKIIRRRAAEGTGDAFVATFFRSLKQQPYGPGVLDSVSTLLTRVDELATSKLPGASEVLKNIRARGLTESKAKEIRSKIQQLRDGLVRPSGRDETAAAEAEAKQAAGLRAVRLAWNDWSTTLRPLYDIREQIQLGLTDARGLAAAPKENGVAGGAGGAGSSSTEPK